MDTLSTVHDAILFPAHAGVIPTTQPVTVKCLSFPRIRGDDPVNNWNAINANRFSPYTRG